MSNENVLDLIYKIQQIARDSEVDAEKTLRGNKTAGIRLRKTMQEIKSVCQGVRDKVQEEKKAS